jgi:hypothetical protein
MGVEKELKADPELKSLYHTYLVTVLIGGFLWWMIPAVTISLFLVDSWIETLAALSAFIPLILVVAVAMYWIPKYHSSIKYVFEDDKIVVTKGVWWKTKSVVPYNRITNINIYQGPISRHFGLAKLAIQTAGFSGVSRQGYKTAEAEIVGIKKFEETKDFVMNFVRGIRPQAVEAEAETRAPGNTNEQVLQELRRIRKAVEKQSA